MCVVCGNIKEQIRTFARFQQEFIIYIMNSWPQRLTLSHDLYMTYEIVRKRMANTALPW